MAEAERKDEPGPATKWGTSAPSRIIDSVELFRGEREVFIIHGGVQYRLRITRRNKLILQK